MTNPQIFLAGLVMLLTSLTPAVGQTVDYGGSNLNPLPGTAHAYSSDLAETVDPQTGGLSIRVQAPVPQERGPARPIYPFIYDSTGQVYWQPAWTYNNSVGQNVLSAASLALATVGLPNSIIFEGHQVSSTVGTGQYATCNYDDGFVYIDPQGGHHPINLTVPFDDSPTGCGALKIQGPPAGQGLGIDDEYTAVFVGSSPAIVIDIFDLHGNLVLVGPNASSPLPEDSNGNYLYASGRAYSQTATKTIVPGLGGPYVLSSSPGNTATGSGLGLNATPLTTHQGSMCATNSNITGSGAGTGSGTETLTLPNSQTFGFAFDPASGYISSISYPTGLSVQYTWTEQSGFRATAFFNPSGNSQYCSYIYNWPAITKRVVSTKGVATLEQDFSYSTTWVGITTPERTTTVTTKDLIRSGSPATKTVYTYIPYTSPSSPQTSTIASYDTTGALLQTITKVWATETQLSAQCTTLGSSGPTSGVFYQYGNSSLLPTDQAEYDYGLVSSSSCTQPSTNATRETKTQYQAFSPTPYSSKTAVIADRPSLVQVYGNGTLTTQTQYVYDHGGVAPATAINHDEKNYASSSTDPRGNPTTITRVCFIGSTACSNSSTTITYDETGQPATVTDANGNQTTYSFQDSYTSDNGSPSGNTNIYVTKITRPTINKVSHISSFEYGFIDGKLRYSNDENSHQTEYCYQTGGCRGTTFDPWLRPTGVAYPDGGGSTTTYVDTVGSASITTTTISSPDPSVTVLSSLDERGHILSTQITSVSPSITSSEITYDGNGQPYLVYSPFYSSGDNSYGYSTLTYDALGRKTTQAQPDGTNQSWTYNGNTTTFQDEAGSRWSRSTDGLGRLVKVLEPSSSSRSPSIETDYGYDALDNLLSVNQKGASGETAHTRAFTYDSLSRLVQAYNPESGWTCYGTVPSGSTPGGSNCTESYDANGNLIYKTDATGMTIGYGYDALNRMISKGASDADNMRGWFYYDTGTNGIGKLSSENRNAVGGETYSYDVMGRISGTTWINYQAGNAPQTGMAVLYDLAGNPRQLTYPDGRVIANAYDGAGRLSTVTDATANGSSEVYFQASSSPLFSGVPSGEYWASGALANLKLGNGVTETFGVNDRLQPCRIAATTTWVPANTSGGNLLDRQNYYQTSPASPCGKQTANNGNIDSIADTVVTGWSQNFTYDYLNRITSGARSDSGYNMSFTYDSFGSMLPSDNIHGSLNYSRNPANNQLLLNTTNFQYDGAGRLAQVPNPLGGSHTFLYTAENYLRCIDSCNTASYLTDAAGHRTFTGRGSVGWNENVYLNDQTMADLDQTGTWTDYVYAAGRQIARVTSAAAPIHLSGTVCSNCGGSATYVQLTSGAGRVIRSGDNLYLSQYAANGSEGGAILLFTDGSSASGLVAQDQNGQQINCDGMKNQWHQRQINLNAYAGKTLQSTLLINDVCSAGGQFDIYFNDVAISGNGTTSTIYSPQMGATFTPLTPARRQGKRATLAL